jgi:hypothetical protein
MDRLEPGVVYDEEGNEIYRYLIEEYNVIPFDNTTKVKVEDLQRQIEFYSRYGCTAADITHYKQLSVELANIYEQHNMVKRIEG